MFLKKFLRKLSKARFPYRPLITIEVSKANILHNIGEFERQNGNISIAPVLKSNAYGHGLLPVARILEALPKKFPFLIVDSYFEALALRSEGIRTPLLIIGYTPRETIVKSKLSNVAFTVISIETLAELSLNLSKKTQIHLKINTGMNRQGIDQKDLEAAFSLIGKNKNIELQGILSHFADADSTEDAFTKQQIYAWNAVVEKTLARFPKLSFYHMSNTPGHAYAPLIQANISRPGGGLYGLGQGARAPIDGKVNLHPALIFKTAISSTRVLEAGEKVGYGLTYTAPKKMKIATIPVGYYEGLDRRLSNKGFVKVNGVFAPIVGRVSMNITTIDVTDVPNVSIGDEVVVISNNPSDKNSIDEIAKLCGTIPYEISTRIPGHLLRVVVSH